jgi:phospholipid transport system transporter-binding protein
MARKRGVASSARTTRSKKQNPALSPASEAPANTILFDRSMDIASAGELQQKLITVLQANTPVELDATNVERVDTAALQVLTAFFKDAEAAGVAVQWKQTSETLDQAAHLLGLGQALHLDTI